MKRLRCIGGSHHNDKFVIDRDLDFVRLIKKQCKERDLGKVFYEEELYVVRGFMRDNMKIEFLVIDGMNPDDISDHLNRIKEQKERNILPEHATYENGDK